LISVTEIKMIITIIIAVFNEHSSIIARSNFRPRKHFARSYEIRGFPRVCLHAHTIHRRLFHIWRNSQRSSQSIGFPKKLCKMLSSDLRTTPCFSVAKSLRCDWPRSRHFQFADGKLCDLYFLKLPFSVKEIELR